MTVPVESPVRFYPLTGTGLGPFATDWKYETAADVQVYLDDGEDLSLLNGGQYTLTGGSPVISGGGVTLNDNVRPAGGWGDGVYTLILRRMTAVDQTVNFGALERFQPDTNETGFDRLTRMVQDLLLDIGRSIKVRLGSGGVSTELPSPVAGGVFQWNDSATGIGIVSIPDLASQVGNAAIEDAIIASHQGVAPSGAIIADTFGASLPAARATKDNLLALMAAHDFVRVDGEINLPEQIDNLDGAYRATLIGTGTVRGIPGKHVIPDDAPFMNLSLQGNCRPDHFPNINSGKASALEVIFVGDSLLTPAHNNNFAFSTGLGGWLEKQLKHICGAMPVTFTNLAIGGAAFGNVLGTRPSNYPTWWTDPAQPWYYYINQAATAAKAAGKAVLIVWGFGMNVDTSLMWTLSNLAAYVTCLSYSDQLFCTNVMPAVNPVDATAAAQNSRIGQMSMQRNWCIKNNIGFIDIGHVYIAALNGYDIRSHRPHENFANTNPSGFVISPPGVMPLVDGACTPQRPVDGGAPVNVLCSNFHWLVDMTDAAWDSTGNNGLYLNIGANQNDILSIRKSSFGTIDIFLYHGDTTLGLTLTASKTGWAPGDSGAAGVKELMIEVVDNLVTVRSIEKDANGAVGLFTEPVFQEHSLRNTAPFTPVMTTVGVGRPVTRVRFDLGRYTLFRPAISTAKAWGISTSDLPDEGTGNNHNTNSLSSLVHLYAIRQAQILGAPLQKSGTWTPTFSHSGGTGPADITASGVYTRFGNLVHCRAQILINNLNGASGFLNIGGVPFDNVGIFGGIAASGGNVAIASAMGLTGGHTTISLIGTGGVTLAAGTYYFVDFFVRL